ncbi:MAG: hypothetical protein ACODAJ_01245 [Planctomycetota bacterium]
MRKLWTAGLVVALFGALAWAGEDRQEGRGRFRGRGRDMRRRFMAMRGGGRGDVDVFETARKMAELGDEQSQALDALIVQHSLEQNEAEGELNRQLARKYMALVIELLPDEEKPKYEKVLAAMVERDEQREAARHELLTVLETVRKEQGADLDGPPDRVPRGKTEILHRYLKVTDEQHQQMDQRRRDGFAAMREEMREHRPDDWRDPQQLQAFRDAMEKARDKIDDQTAEQMADLLTEEQKQAYQTAVKAYDAYQAKIDEIDAAFQAKLVEAVGEEKAQELQRREPPWARRRPRGDRRRPGRPGGGRQPQPGADF